ncbi:gamma-glutamylcyclotransferase family protein [Nocardioides sp. AX2bis]|uniref:gamma-glutamylcyclotransferase family protein n=1 Tax=Nocardioides sp. AX2bis TaxID=2653157 RepID=UPI0012F25223|nr:gamma-glutamylcyclotransferase family protein [Nocardioides sp. AX2bis]VXB34821.1 Gamma-glutamylcyclotransferase [Nocardioides sp. AX2bis]
MTDRLFVYGTLAPGQLNEHVLAGIPGRWEPGAVTGRLVDEGWGAASGYRSVVLETAGEPVRGSVLTSPALLDHWSRLDEFEGEGYERVPAEVALADGSWVTAQVYAARSTDG